MALHVCSNHLVSSMIELVQLCSIVFAAVLALEFMLHFEGMTIAVTVSSLCCLVVVLKAVSESSLCVQCEVAAAYGRLPPFVFP